MTNCFKKTSFVLEVKAEFLSSNFYLESLVLAPYSWKFIVCLDILRLDMLFKLYKVCSSTKPS